MVLQELQDSGRRCYDVMRVETKLMKLRLGMTRNEE
jgi:hypothetical protein